MAKKTTSDVVDGGSSNKKGPYLKHEPNYRCQNNANDNNSNFDYILFLTFHPIFQSPFIYYFENIAVNIVSKNIIPIPIAGFNN